MAQTVKGFIEDSYQLISASTPTVPLHGNDMSKGVQFFNELIDFYSASGLLTTIATELVIPLNPGVQNVTFGSSTHVPPPDVASGRLSNLLNSWLELDGVTYPLIDLSFSEFFASFKFDPQLGLPRYVIVTNQLELTNLRLFPGTSQAFDLHVYAKFQLPNVTENSTMAQFPTYMLRFLKLAIAKDLALYKGRELAWGNHLEQAYREAKDDMESVSTFNLAIVADIDSSLNANWRVMAGV